MSFTPAAQNRRRFKRPAFLCLTSSSSNVLKYKTTKSLFKIYELLVNLSANIQIELTGKLPAPSHGKEDLSFHELRP